MSRREHFEHGGSEHDAAPFTDRHGLPAWQDPAKDVDYDEHFPEPSSRPGMVEFGGHRLPANTMYKSDVSMGFTTPMENGAVAQVHYYPRQQQATVSMMRLMQPGNHVHGTLLGAYDEHGLSAPGARERIVKAHGGDERVDMPLAPHEVGPKLREWSQIEIPEHVRRDNQRGLHALGEQWGWKP